MEEKEITEVGAELSFYDLSVLAAGMVRNDAALNNVYQFVFVTVGGELSKLIRIGRKTVQLLMLRSGSFLGKILIELKFKENQMRLYRIAILFSLLVLGISSQVSFAQQKNGHVHAQAVFSTMPDAKAAQNTIEAFSKIKSDEINKMQGEYQIKYDAAVAKNKTLSEANKDLVVKELQVMSEELESLKKRIELSAQKAQQEVGAKQAELLAPINTKFMSALKAVAKEKGLTYVFDVNEQQGNNLLVWDDGIDVTSEVKTKLGISNSTSTSIKK